MIVMNEYILDLYIYCHESLSATFEVLQTTIVIKVKVADKLSWH